MAEASLSHPAMRPANAQTDGKTIGVNVNGQTWLDTAGKPINAHGGGVIVQDGVYYWYGEHRAPRGPNREWRDMPGVHCYSSTDLIHWKDEGLALVVPEQPQGEFERGVTIERPKVVYNEKTRTFVMWMHLELKGQGYAAARAALAVSESPTGPFRYVRSLRPNAGIWPIDLPESARVPLTGDATEQAFKDAGGHREGIVAGVYTRRDFAGGQMSRDMTLFVDPDDKKGYLISSAEENFTLNIHELTDDYQSFTGKWTRVQPAGHNEAPAIVKQDGRYYMLASGCTGWDPNEARSLVASSIWGPWQPAGNPCVGTNPANNLGPNLTWGGQSTFIFARVDKPGEYIAMFDVWRPRRDLSRSGYIWAPMRITDGRMQVEWRDEWKP